MLAGEYMSIDVKRILGTALLELTQKKAFRIFDSISNFKRNRCQQTNIL